MLSINDLSSILEASGKLFEHILEAVNATTLAATTEIATFKNNEKSALPEESNLFTKLFETYAYKLQLTISLFAFIIPSAFINLPHSP